MGYKVVTDSTSNVVTRAEAKAHLRVDHTDEDGLIDGLIVAAEELCEAKTNRVFMPKVVRLVMDDWPKDEITLPRAPFRSSTVATTVRYIASGTTSLTTWASTNYIVDDVSEPPRIVRKNSVSWPTQDLRPANAVWVDFAVGYAGSTAVPESVKMADKLLVGHWYVHREGVLTGSISKPIEMAVDALLAPYIVPVP